MTRLAKEAWNHYTRQMIAIEVDMQLSCGCYPAGAYDKMYQEADRLLDLNAKLRGYDSHQDFCYASMEKEPDEVKYGWA